jgi:hypothetical protein
VSEVGPAGAKAQCRLCNMTFYVAYRDDVPHTATLDQARANRDAHMREDHQQ